MTNPTPADETRREHAILQCTLALLRRDQAAASRVFVDYGNSPSRAIELLLSTTEKICELVPADARELMIEHLDAELTSRFYGDAEMRRLLEDGN